MNPYYPSIIFTSPSTVNLPFFTIIIPAYNVESFLPDTLSSVLGQTYKNIEVIVVDDASTDQTKKIALQYTTVDSRLQILAHPCNLGQFTARLTGAQHAKGQYLWFIDGDDSLDIRACEELHLALENCAFAPDMVSFSYCLVNSQKDSEVEVRHKWAVPGLYEGKQSVASFIVQNSTNSICCKLIRKDFFLKKYHLLNEIGNCGAEDIAYHYFYSRAEKVLVLNKTLYHYYSPRKGSDSTGVSRRQLTGILDVTLHAMDLFQKSDFPIEEKSFVIRRYARCVLDLHDYLWLNLSEPDRKEYAPKLSAILKKLTKQDYSAYAQWYDNILRNFLFFGLNHMSLNCYYILKVYFFIYFLFHIKTYFSYFINRSEVFLKR